MVQRRRVSASRRSSSASQSPSPEEMLPFLAHVTAGCYVIDAKIVQCIPLYLMRGRIRNAVAFLRSAITGKYKCSTQMLTGYVSGAPSSVVVPLEGCLSHLVDEYFTSLRYSEANVAAQSSSQPVWYGIIDGCQLFGAFSEEMALNPSKWSSFLWKVIVVQPGRSIEEYRQLARVQNERSKSIYHYECTLYDLLCGLRQEYDTLYAEIRKHCPSGDRGTKVPQKDVAHRYDGGDHSSNTSVKQAVTVASRLGWKTIKTLGEVINMECADIIAQTAELNVHSLTSTSEVLAQQDCRLFRSFLCFGALRASKAFMAAIENNQEDAQVNTIYRIKHWCELHRYKPVQSKVISQQFQLAIWALKEEQKFLNAIDDENWPPNMETARENLLRTTVCDKEIEQNCGNDGDILDSVWKCFSRLFPARARSIEEHENGNGEQSPTPDTDENPVPPEPADDNPGDDEERKREQERLEKERIRLLQKAADKILLDVGISVSNSSFSHFVKHSWSSNSTRGDLVLSTIPVDCDEVTLQSIPDFCNHVLYPGGYCFFIVNEKQFTTLFDLFKHQSFKVFDHSYKILYDVNSFQRRVTNDFPQKHGDIAILARSPGTHPLKFNPSFNEDPKRFASLSTVKACQHRLKKPGKNSPMYAAEKSVELYTHIVSMFSHDNGLVIDPLAGAMTTALACLKTSRKSICIEQDKELFRYAIGRLRVHAVPDATMEHHNHYSIEINGEYQQATPESDDNSTPQRTGETDGTQTPQTRLQTIDEETCSATSRKRRRLSSPSASRNLQNEDIMLYDDYTTDDDELSDGADTISCEQQKLREPSTADALLLMHASSEAR